MYTFTLMTEADALTVSAWRYDGPYAAYNADSEGGDDPADVLAGYLNRRSPCYAVRNLDVDATGALVGFFGYGSFGGVVFDGSPAHIYNADGSVYGGLGMRPDLTGRGLGLAFVQAGVAFCEQTYHPTAIIFYVLPFNERALRVYERAGFRHVGITIQRGAAGERPFVKLRRA